MSRYHRRLGIFWCMNSFAQVLNGFLAAGLLEMRGVLGYAGWVSVGGPTRG